MPLILGTNSIKVTGYDVDNSVRLNAGDNPSMAVTQGTPTNVDKYTFSVWVKRADLGAGNSKIFSVQGSNVNAEEKLEFNNDDLIWRQTEASAGNTSWERVTDKKFRDPSAWYHIVVAYDSSQGTAGNRCKMYINGVQETSFSGSSDPSSNLDSFTNTSGSSLKLFASCTNINSQNAGAYFAEMVYVDGQQLTPTSFGEFDEDSGIWKPIDLSDLTFGNNGFYCDFEDSSALGNDVSGNNNDLSVTNIASTDQSTDTCTNNFATLNPIYHYIDSATLSEGNLKFTTSGNSSKGRGISTIRPESGKWYVECKIIDVTRFSFGLMNGNETNSSQGGNDTNSVIFDYVGGFYMAGSFSSYLSAPNNNDIVQLALDLDNDLFWIGVNDTWGNSATRTQIENGTASNDATTFISSQVPINTGAIGIFLEDNSGTGNNVAEINFGNPTFSISSGNSDGNGYGNFEYAVPSGYYALNTKNLAEYG